MSENRIKAPAGTAAGPARYHADQHTTGEPRIVGFFCNWCTYTAADLAGISRLAYAPNVRVVRVMCSGRIDPQFMLAAFREGADGVLIGGCHPGDCHYQEGNYKCLRRFALLKRVVKALGIEPERLRLEWISASEGDKVQRVINEMTTQVRRLGPLGWKRIPVHGQQRRVGISSGVPSAGPNENRTDRTGATGGTSDTSTADHPAPVGASSGAHAVDTRSASGDSSNTSAAGAEAHAAARAAGGGGK
jgi:F420-non-reducing hydrogenase iron-sulfur subunit